MKSNDAIRLMLFIGITFLMTSCDTFRYANSGSNATTKVKPKKKSNTNIKDAKTIQRNEITTYSKNYVGVKYKYAGKDPKGFDCSGFTSYVMAKHDVAISPSSKAQATQGKAISLNKVKPGDLIFFGKKGGKTVTHVALVVANEADGIYVIHSTSSKGVMVQNVSKSTYWKPKILFARDVLSN
jgi:cell wall-associated NlpC family hydrolase